MRSALCVSVICAATMAVFACQKQSVKDAETAGGQSTTPGAASTAPKAAAATTAAGKPGGALGSGKVLETMTTAGYTYVRAMINGKEIWAAGPESAVKVGDTVTLPEGALMENYSSQTLNRTFERVYFVGSLGVPKAGGAAAQGAAAGAPHGAPAGAPHGAAGQPHGKPGAIAGHGGASAAAPTPAAVTGIAKAKGGKTVQEVFAGKAELSGKEVLIRGKVVKFTTGIMKRNWLHVQDGTGTAGTNDLTVTTLAMAKVGDTVLIKGKVTTNKDFGAGYKYDVIVEDATLTTE